MLIDMHLHTRRSKDSSLSFTDAVEGAKLAGLDALCVTEHGRFTSEQEVAEMMERYDFIIFGGAEFNTTLGHFLVYDSGHPQARITGAPFQLNMFRFINPDTTAEICAW